MKKTETKIQKSYTDHGLGFPVQIINAPMRKIRGKWTLDVNFAKYEKAILFVLAHKPVRLTGNEIKFIRHYFEMDLKSFGKRFGDVAHSAVIKWEKSGDELTSMGWSTEKDIRLSIIEELKPKGLRKIYAELSETAPRKKQKVKIDFEALPLAV